MCKAITAREMKKRIAIRLTNREIFRSEEFNLLGGRTEFNSLFDEKVGSLIDENSIDEKWIKSVCLERLPEEGKLYLSDHAIKRLKKRNGWSKKTSLRMVEKIYEQGKPKEGLKGSLATWVSRKNPRETKNTEYRLYGEKLYIFDGPVLVTVINTPRKGSHFNPAKYTDNEWRQEVREAV